MLLGVLVFSIFIIAVSLVFYSPLLGALLLIACIPYDIPIEFGLTLYLNQIVLSGLLAGTLLKAAQQSRLKELFSNYWIMTLAVFTAVVIASAFNAEHFSNVVKQWLRWMEIPLAAWIIYRAVQNRNDMKTTVMMIIISAVITSLIGIIQTLAGPNASFNVDMALLFTVDQGATMRAYSTFGHPNQFAGYLILAIPLAFIQFMEVQPMLRRAVVGFMAVVMITALIFTFSRGGWIATIFIGGGLIYLNIPKKMKMIIALITALTATVVILYQGPLEGTRKAVVDRVASFTQPEKEDSVGFRGVCVKTGLKMIKKHPWIGFGAGEYDRNIRNYFDEKYYAWEAINKHIHSWYLQIWIEIGLAGLIAFIFLFIAVFLPMGRIFLSSQSSYERQLLSGVIGAILAFLIHNLFDALTVYARGIHFGVIIGLGLAICTYMEKTRRSGKSVSV